VCEYVWIVNMYDIQTVGSSFDIVIIIAMVMDNPGVASQAFSSQLSVLQISIGWLYSNLTSSLVNLGG